MTLSSRLRGYVCRYFSTPPIIPLDLPVIGVSPTTGHLLARRDPANSWGLAAVLDLDSTATLAASAEEDAISLSLMLMGG